MNLVRLGEERIQKFGEIVTVVFENEEYTNVRINEMGRRLASGLKSLGIGRGDHVVVSLSNSPEVFACFQAIWRIGAVIVPIMFLLGENESTYIPLGTVHRLENPGKVELEVIEVQSGSYLGEDDIVRFEDVYDRVPAA